MQKQSEKIDPELKEWIQQRFDGKLTQEEFKNKVEGWKEKRLKPQQMLPVEIEFTHERVKEEKEKKEQEEREFKKQRVERMTESIHRLLEVQTSEEKEEIKKELEIKQKKFPFMEDLMLMRRRPRRGNRMEYLKKLAALADTLDEKGFSEEADEIDSIVQVEIQK